LQNTYDESKSLSKHAVLMDYKKSKICIGKSEHMLAYSLQRKFDNMVPCFWFCSGECSYSAHEKQENIPLLLFEKFAEGLLSDIENKFEEHFRILLQTDLPKSSFFHTWLWQHIQNWQINLSKPAEFVQTEASTKQKKWPRIDDSLM